MFAVLYVTGMRIGEALGLRHEDITAAEPEITVRPRLNANGARTKSATARTIPISAELVRLYADYLHEEYGDLDSDCAPGEIARVLGRSSGAVANALDTLTKQGTAVMTCERPNRYRAAATPTQVAESADASVAEEAA